MDKELPFGGLIGYGNSYLDSILCYSKVFRLHAILHDAAGYYMMLLEQFDHILAEELATVT